MSSHTKQIATQLRTVLTGGNWTWSNFKDHLADVTWEEANKKVGSINTIVGLVYHAGYYVSAQITVLKGGPLNAKDEYSFDHPPIRNEEEWKSLVANFQADGEQLAQLIEDLPDEKLQETFVNEKYGNYYRNFHGVIEHHHYHLGQIAVIKKLIREMP